MFLAFDISFSKTIKRIREKLGRLTRDICLFLVQTNLNDLCESLLSGNSNLNVVEKRMIIEAIILNDPRDFSSNSL